MKTWELKVKLEVGNVWLEDGFDASERIEEINDLLSSLLPHAFGSEFKITTKIIKAPKKEELLKIQGYKV